jgi:predicted transcriptional regulator
MHEDSARHRVVGHPAAGHHAEEASSAAAGSGEPGSEDHSARRGAGELAAAVLSALQAAGMALSPGQVRDRLDADLAYTTVVTILSRLHDKGVLERRKVGRAYAYAPVADEPGLAARRMVRVLDGEADRETVLARFVSGLSESDEELLRKMLGDRTTGERGT